VAKFWHTEPFPELDQRKGRFEFGLYPAAFFNDRNYNSEMLNSMVEWCRENIKNPMSYSERYGSFYFSDENDRVLFRLYYSDETMPEPDFIIG
jgi:hypothetical protein